LQVASVHSMALRSAIDEMSEQLLQAALDLALAE
jgi:hypothetical protein